MVEEGKHVGVTNAVGTPHWLNFGKFEHHRKDAQLCTCCPSQGQSDILVSNVAQQFSNINLPSQTSLHLSSKWIGYT